MSEIASDALTALRRYRWAIFAVLTVGYFFVYFHRISVSVVPSGVMADRFGARAASTVFLLIASIGSLVTCVGTEFWMIVLGKVMIAAGMAVVYVPLMKLVSVWFPKSDFAVLSGVVIAVGNVGAIAATGPLELMAQALGWREVFLVLGVITLVLAVLCATVIRNHPKDRGLPSVEAVELSEHGTAVVESSAARIPVMKGLRIVLSGGRKFWTCALAYFLVYGSIMTFQGTWAVTYFNNVYDFVLSASWMVTALGVGKILSTLAIGGMTSRGIIRSKRKAMIYGTSVFTVLWAVIFVFAGDIDSYWFWFAVSFAFGFFGGFMTLSFTQVKEWYPIAISGTAVSGTNIFLFLGASVCTTISGAIIGTAYTLDNFTVLWGLMLLFSAVAVVLLVLSVEKRPEDPPVGVELVREASDS